MLASNTRPFTRLIGITKSAKFPSNRIAKCSVVAYNIDTSVSNFLTARRFITTEQEKHYQGIGVLDDQGLTVFKTLHELQVNSSLVFKENELFGTYNDETETFHYMTYEEYDQKVNRCRVLLKDLGTWTEVQFNSYVSKYEQTIKVLIFKNIPSFAITYSHTTCLLQYFITYQKGLGNILRSP